MEVEGEEKRDIRCRKERMGKEKEEGMGEEEVAERGVEKQIGEKRET